jgi:hypothetical protein
MSALSNLLGAEADIAAAANELHVMTDLKPVKLDEMIILVLRCRHGLDVIEDKLKRLDPREKTLCLD